MSDDPWVMSEEYWEHDQLWLTDDYKHDKFQIQRKFASYIHCTCHNDGVKIQIYFLLHTILIFIYTVEHVLSGHLCGKEKVVF